MRIKSALCVLLLFFSFCFSYDRPVDYYRTITVTDFFEIISLYKSYLDQSNTNVLYGTGLSLSALGLSQGSNDVLISGLTYLGNGLLNQFNISRSPYSQKLEQYRREVVKTTSRQEVEQLCTKAMKELIEDERFNNQLTGGLTFFNGALFLTNPNGKGLYVGALMMLFGAYLAFMEKGPLERMVSDYEILDERKVSFNMDQIQLPGVASPGIQENN
ncbi:MAG: hypothetical protein PHV30_05330 [Candidatus Margulisbacteria bacterium]|nr:hypothetical protein [Candidatus Margulisiibacteriota bacterium]